MQPSQPHRSTTWLPLVVLLALHLLVIVQRAWVGDDAFITLRTIDNFANGFGLVYNVGERVQSYTHPLWLLLISPAYFVTREPYYTLLALSLLVSMAAALVVVFGLGLSRRGAVLALLALTLSSAYVDYSTSGLENPLTHLLLAVFLAVFLRLPSSGRKLLWLSLVAALGVINRMDSGLLFLPVLVYEFRRTPAPWRRRAGLVALGMTPFLLWELFSLVYYGFLVPNTALAKLTDDMAGAGAWQQGLVYLLDALRNDPLTPLVILSGLVVAVWSRDRRARLIALGVALYLVYLVSIGGDFMSGRFLTAPLLAAVVVIGMQRLEALSAESFAVALGALAVVGLLAPYPTLRATEHAVIAIGESMIVNERLYYIDNSLTFASQNKPMPGNAMRHEGAELRFNNAAVDIRGPVGMPGFYAGPGVHVIDHYGLIDPLIARLPPIHSEIVRPGHHGRVIPEGYEETLTTGENRIVDSQLAEYYDRLSLITRGPIWRLARWREIWRFNTGYYDGWFDEEPYRFPELTAVDGPAVAAYRPAGTSLDDPGVTTFNFSGIDVVLPALSHGQQVQLSLDGNTRYVLWFMNQGRVVDRVWLDDTGGRFAGQLVVHHADVPEAVSRAGFDRVRIIPRQAAEQYALGHLRLFGAQEWPTCGAASGCTIPFSDTRVAGLLAAGWAAPEAWGVWNDGPASRLSLYLNGRVDYRLVVRAFPAEGLCDQTLVVWLNGEPVGEQPFNGCEERELGFELPGALVRAGLNDVGFAYGATAAPGEATGDLRQLAAGFVELRLEPLGD